MKNIYLNAFDSNAENRNQQETGFKSCKELNSAEDVESTVLRVKEEVSKMNSFEKASYPDAQNRDNKRKVRTTCDDLGLEVALEEAEMQEAEEKRERQKEFFRQKQNRKKETKETITIYLTKEEGEYVSGMSRFYEIPKSEFVAEKVKEEAKKFCKLSKEVMASYNEEEALKRLRIAENYNRSLREYFEEDVIYDMKLTIAQKDKIIKLFGAFELPDVTAFYQEDNSILDKLLKVAYYPPKVIQLFYDKNKEELKDSKIRKFFNRYIRNLIKDAKYIEFLYHVAPAHKVQNCSSMGYGNNVLLIREDGETWLV